MLIQLGANENQNLGVNLINVKTDSIGTAGINLTSGAEQAITAIDNAISTVSGYGPHWELFKIDWKGLFLLRQTANTIGCGRIKNS